MKEFCFKYDMVRIDNNSCEFCRIKKRPFFKILYDIIVNRLSFTYLVIPVLYFATKWTSHPISGGYMLGLTLIILLQIIRYDFSWHKNGKISTARIKSSHIRGKTLEINYKVGRKIIDIQDKQILIPQLQEIPELKFD